jgi:hypothetical protein
MENPELLPMSNTEGAQQAAICPDGPKQYGGKFPPPPRTPEYSFEQVCRALIDAHGRHSVAAKALGCASRTIGNYCERYPRLRELELDLRKARVDMAEGVLDNHLKAGSLTASLFTLRTIGGYKEKTESAVSFTGPPLTVEYLKLTAQDQAAA